MRLRTALVTRGHTAGLKDGTVVPRTFEFMRVGVERGPSWAATAPSLLIKEGYVTAPAGSPGRTYDIAPGGERFLLIKTASGSELGRHAQQPHRRPALRRGARAARPGELNGRVHARGARISR